MLCRIARIGFPAIGLAAVAAVACTDAATRTDQLSAPVFHRMFTTQDSLEHGYFDAQSTSRSLVPASAMRDAITESNVSIVSVSPGWFQGADQPQTITAVVSGPVNSITVSGRGAILCSGNYGSLIAYDSRGGVVGSVPLELIDPSDCSPPENPDNITYGARASLTSSAGIIASFQITPMSPLTFPVPGTPGGRASQTYTVQLGAASAAPPSLIVSCPASAVRGSEIACTVKLSDATAPFEITEMTAGVNSGDAVFSLAFQAPAPLSAGSTYSLAGPAVASTTLSVKAVTTWKGAALSLAASADFSVTARPAESSEYIMTLRPEAAGPGRTTKYPSFGGGTLGLYGRQPPDFDEIQVATSATGPNKGLSYVVSIPGIPASLINLTFALFPGDPWYEAHPAESGPRNDLGQLICTKSQIDQLRLQVERHEGITMASNSHFGIDQDLLRKWNLARTMGSHVIATSGSAEAIRQQMAMDFATEWRTEDAYLRPLQEAFDASDTPAMYAGLGCSIFLKL